MSHFANGFWYLFLAGIIVGSFYLSSFLIKKFDAKWKTVTEEEQREQLMIND